MAYTWRNKRLAYDNIAVGSTTGRENIVVGGNTTPGETTRYNLDGALVSHPEMVIGTSRSDSAAGGVAVTNAGGVSHTASDTSDTSAFPEIVG